MRMTRMVNQAVSRFVVKNYETANPDCYIDMLDILESWNEYKIENANGITIDPKLISKKIAEVFPECKISEYRINGISKRNPIEKPVKKQLAPEELAELQFDDEMRMKFEKFIGSRSIDRRTAPFTIGDFTDDCQILQIGDSFSMSSQECSEDDAEKWLSKQDFLYFDSDTGKWCFHQRVYA